MPRPQWLAGPDAGLGFYWLSTPEGLTVAEVSVSSGGNGPGLAGFVYRTMYGWDSQRGWRPLREAEAGWRWQRLYEPADAPHGNQEAQR